MARSSIHLLGVPATRSNTRKTSPLIWFENEWDLLEGGKKSRLYKGMCTDLGYSQSQCGCKKKLSGALSPASQDHPIIYPAPHQAPTPAPPAPVLLSTKVEAARESVYSGRKGSLLGARPASDQDGSSHCQCVH